MDAGGGHSFHFFFRRAFAAGDDRAGMTHPASRRRGLAADESNDGLFDMGLDVFGGFFFGAASDFTNHNNGVGIRVVVEQLDGVFLRRADNRIAADANAGGLADPQAGQLADSFIRQCAAALNDPDPALKMNAGGHNADFAFAWRNDARAIGADQANAARLNIMKGFDHIQRRNAFGDADDQGDARVGGFHNRVGGERRRNVNDGHIRAGFFDGVGDRIEDRKAFVRRAAFAGRDAADNVRAVIAHLQGVESSFLAGESLDNQTSVFINQNAQSGSSEVNLQINLMDLKAGAA